LPDTQPPDPGERFSVREERRGSMTNDYYELINWEEYQHYKNRKPIWIKLYQDILTSPTWIFCDDQTKALMVAIMLLAARTNNRVPASLEYIQTAGNLKKKPNLKSLVNTGFMRLVRCDSELIATSDSDTIDREEKKREEKRRHPAQPFKKELQTLADHHADLFEREKAPITLDDHCKRIVKVLEKFGLQKCMVIQVGHHAKNSTGRYTSWQHAYPQVKREGKQKVTEPNWQWISDYHSAGEKVDEWPT
jgi:hypothetical protein